MKLYKILVNGKSCHGGDFKWSLPQNGKPGKWHKHKGVLVMCDKGFHLTNKPFEWYEMDCECYEAEIKGTAEWKDDKCVCSKVRLIKKVKHPKWWLDTLKFISKIKKIKYFQPDGKPLKEWKVFNGDDWNAAWNAARSAAWNAAGNAARNAAWNAAGNAAWNAAWSAAGDAARGTARDAALMAQQMIVKDKVNKKHFKHAQDRMKVWQKGYGLLCDINGILYVYAKK
jgi:hypothetical protein